MRGFVMSSRWINILAFKLFITSFLIFGSALAQTANLPEKARQSIVYIYFDATDPDFGDKVTVQGTGFVVSGNGYVLTAAHLFKSWLRQNGGDKQSNLIRGTIRDKPGFVAESPFVLSLIDPGDPAAQDIALLKLPDPAASRPYIAAAICFQESTGLKSGDDLEAFGFPLDQSFQPIGVMLGTQNARGGRWGATSAFDQGMSGGPVYSKNGFVVGIVEGGLENSNAVRWITPINYADKFLRIASVSECCDCFSVPSYFWGWLNYRSKLSVIATVSVITIFCLAYFMGKGKHNMKDMQRKYSAFKQAYENRVCPAIIDKGKPASTLLCLRSGEPDLEDRGGLEIDGDLRKRSLEIAATLKDNEWMGFLEDHQQIAWGADPLKLPYCKGSYSTYRASLQTKVPLVPLTAGALICCTARNAVVYCKRSSKVDTFASDYHHLGGGFKAGTDVGGGDRTLIATARREISEESGGALDIDASRLTLASALIEGGTNYFQYQFLGVDLSREERESMRHDPECQAVDFAMDDLGQQLIDKPFVPTCLLQTMIWLSIGAPTSSGRKFNSRVVRAQLGKLTKHYGIKM